MQTFSDEHFIYSVDMMMAYLLDFQPPVDNIQVSSLMHTLEHPGWGDPEKKLFYSALDVVKSPSKYPKEYERIEKADLKYPIIIANGFVVDGVHRLSKAYLQHKPTIKAYVFPKKLLQQFVIGKQGSWEKVGKIPVFKMIHMYFQKFCSSK